MAEVAKKVVSRSDVLQLLNDNNGRADGIDLSRRLFEQGIDLRRLNLRWIKLNGSVLIGAHFEGSDLCFSNLEEASLVDAHLEGTDLRLTQINGADFDGAHLEGASLFGTELSAETKLASVDWGNGTVGEEREGKYARAADVYRRLKIWHARSGIRDKAGQFYLQEKTAKRKSLRWWPNPIPKAWSHFLSLICGYGEKWHRAVIIALVIIIGLAIVYQAGGAFSPSNFINSLYYSTVSFTVFGYFSWIPEPLSWAKWLGAAEVVVGALIIAALFTATLSRRMTR